MAAELEFFDDAGAFLVAAGDLLAAHPVEMTVLASVTDRLRQATDVGLPAPSGFPLWWLLVRDEAGAPVGAGMRTAPFAPHPTYLSSMPEAAALELARTLHRRGEMVGGVIGALPAAEVFAAETARATGGTARVTEHTRLHVLEVLHEPVAPAGLARLAREDEVDQVLGWYDAFGRDAAEQAGRDDAHPGPEEDRDSMLRRIAEGTVWVWEDASGRAVHFTGATRPVFGVSRIGPVYTPRERRRQGYAAATVAAVSRALVVEGARVCLFTDQANPTSNALYERLGYRSLVDQAIISIG